MMRFAERTGLASDGAPRRYLWTDAFAVCNFLGLARVTARAEYGELARRLVDHVHRELGRYRADDERAGWISGLSEAEGRAHPTRGGLRIGKPLPERSPTEPLDPEAEWDRDGQYFHYLTKWAHALDGVARATEDAEVHGWARELIEVAHRAFVRGPRGRRRMAWKLSTDLSRALVPSMGQHDPLDGFVACAEIEATRVAFGFPGAPSLEGAMEDFATMIDPDGLATSDPLGLGGLLVDACRLASISSPRRDLVARLLAAAAEGIDDFLSIPLLRAPARGRLAFRELGLAIGLAAIAEMQMNGLDRLDARETELIALLARHLPLCDQIESFWLDAEHRQSPIFVEHRDINEVMLATSLVPDGFLVLGGGAARASR
jgi:hypothetical protein